MRQLLVDLYRSPGWTELETNNQLQPYVEERQLVNEIGEKVTLCKLNAKGERIAKRVLRKRGYQIDQSCGAAIQERSWAEDQKYPGNPEDLLDAAHTFASWVEPPIRFRDMPYGVLMQIEDPEQAGLDFSQAVGWERHQQFGEELKRGLSDALRWLWQEILIDLQGSYREVALWNT